MRKVISTILIIMMMLSLGSVIAFADSEVVSTDSSVEYFDDGSYVVVTLDVDESVSAARATKTKSGGKSYKYYSAKDKLLWIVTVHGTFTYTGSKATCTKATTSSEVYDNDWKVTSATASKSGNKAIGNFTVKRYLLGIPTATKEVKDLTLICSASGVLS